MYYLEKKKGLIYSHFRFTEMFRDNYKELLYTLHSLTGKNLPHFFSHSFSLYVDFFFFKSEPFENSCRDYAPLPQNTEHL